MTIDLHKKGVYCVLTPKGTPLLETVAETGYSARAEFIRAANKRWSVAEEAGYTIVELVPAVGAGESPAVDVELERPAFEEYMSDSGKWPRAIERSSAGNYMLGSTEAAWHVWQERAVLGPLKGEDA